MPMILVEITVLVLVPSEGISLNFSCTFYEVFVLDLWEFLPS